MAPGQDQRVCLGCDQTSFRCHRYMSHEDVDPHVLCLRCRRLKYSLAPDWDCSVSKRCPECKNWPLEQFRLYDKRYKYASRSKSLSQSSIESQALKKSRASTASPKRLVSTEYRSPLPETRRGASPQPSFLSQKLG